MAVFFAFIAFIGWGTSGIFSTISSRKIGYIRALFWQCIFAIILCSLYIPFAPNLFSDFLMLLYAIILAIINVIAFLFYFKGVEVGNPTLVGSIAYSFPIITTLLSVIFLHEQLTVLQSAAISLAFLGIILILFPFKELK